MSCYYSLIRSIIDYTLYILDILIFSETKEIKIFECL
jgi:hypothetical protein